jgi:hypothetical protein
LTTSLSATLYLLDSDLVLTFLPVCDYSFAYPFGLINIVRLIPSASCVWIWVSPCALILLAKYAGLKNIYLCIDFKNGIHVYG